MEGCQKVAFFFYAKRTKRKKGKREVYDDVRRIKNRERRELIIKNMHFLLSLFFSLFS
jgi:hypothetical protein